MGRDCCQVGDAVRRSSTVARRSSVVTPSLAAILGKVDAAPDVLTFQDAAPAPSLGSTLDKRAFFPNLVQLAMVSSYPPKGLVVSQMGAYVRKVLYH